MYHVFSYSCKTFFIKTCREALKTVILTGQKAIKIYF